MRLPSGTSTSEYGDGATRKPVDQVGDVKWRGDAGKTSRALQPRRFRPNMVVVEVKDRQV